MVEIASRARNLTVYGVGVGLATVGALGLAGAIDLALPLASGIFILGLGCVVFVHEHLDGPL